MQKILKLIRHVDTNLQKERLDICRGCKFYVKATASCGPLIVGRKLTKEEQKELDVKHYKAKIRLCGCRMKEKVKYSWAECPAGFWGKQIEEKELKIAEKEKKEITDFLLTLRGQSKIEREQLERLYNIASEVQGKRLPISTCPPCIKDMINYLLSELGKTNAIK